MHLINGKMLALKIREQLRAEIRTLEVQPRLHVLLVGHDPASELYVSLKEKAARAAGIAIQVERRPATDRDEDLIGLIERWNKNEAIHAILVQLPLPTGHDEDRIIAAMDPQKDVDGFHPQNIQAMRDGAWQIVPPVIEGCLRLMNQSPVTINGSRSAIIANSDIFALPFERLLKSAGSIVSVMKPDEINKQALALADVIVIAVGRPQFLNRGMTKRDAVIIDVGTNRLDDGRLVGDVDQATYEETEAWITPVPGGVGPMTIAMLLKNVTELAKRHM